MAALTTGATEASSRMLENHSVGLTTLAAIAATLFTAGMWLERRLTRIEDTLMSLPCRPLQNGRPCSRNRKRRKRN